MFYFIFTHWGEYAAGAIGVVAPSPEEAINLVVAYGKSLVDKYNEKCFPKRTEDFYINKDTVFHHRPDDWKDKCTVWAILDEATVAVDPSTPPGVRFHEFHDG